MAGRGGARAASCGGGRCDGSGRDASSRRGRDAPWPATASARLASATAKTTATVDGARRGIWRRATGVWGRGGGERASGRAACPLPSELSALRPALCLFFSSVLAMANRIRSHCGSLPALSSGWAARMAGVGAARQRAAIFISSSTRRRPPAFWRTSGRAQGGVDPLMRSYSYSFYYFCPKVIHRMLHTSHHHPVAVPRGTVLPHAVAPWKAGPGAPGPGAAVRTTPTRARRLSRRGECPRAAAPDALHRTTIELVRRPAPLGRVGSRSRTRVALRPGGADRGAAGSAIQPRRRARCPYRVVKKKKNVDWISALLPPGRPVC